jgi:drug/metabolite transporter (DMT)-like permease
MQLLCAGAALCAAGGELARIHASSLASESGIALGYLIIFGSLVAYSSYEWLIRHASRPLAGTHACVNPVVAVLLGWWLLAEHITGRTLLAVTVIVAGVILLVLPARQHRRARYTGPAAPGAANQSRPRLPAVRP